MALKRKLLLALVASFLVIFSFLEILDYYKTQNNLRADLLREGRTISGVLGMARSIYDQHFLESDLPLPDHARGAFPAHAIENLVRQSQEHGFEGISFKNVAEHPINPQNLPSATEREAIAYFRQYPEAKEMLSQGTGYRGEPVYHYASPLRLQAYCLECHGQTIADPGSGQVLEPALQVGDLYGALSINFPAADFDKLYLDLFGGDLLVHLSGFLFTFWITWWLLQRTVIRRLANIKTISEAMAEGDLSVRVAVGEPDELGAVAQAFNNMVNAIVERETRLKVKKERLAEAQKIARLGYWELDLASKAIVWSAEVFPMFGFRYREIEPDLDFYVGLTHPDDRSLLQPAIAEALQGREAIYDLEHRITRKDGEIRHMHLRGQLVRDDAGQPVRLMGTVQDITDRYLAGQQLRSSEQQCQMASAQFRGLFDGIPDVLILLGLGCRLAWANRKAADLIHAQAPLESSDIFCLRQFQIQLQDCAECPIRQGFEGTLAESVALHRMQGKTFEVRLFPVCDEKGRIVQLILMARDVSEKLLLEDELLRTGQLASLGELAAGVAHEINNPINGIINYAQILAGEAVEQGEMEEIAQRIINEGDRIAVIVRNLHSLARQGVEEALPVSIHNVLNDTLVLVRAQLNKDGIRVECDLPKDLPWVQAITQQLMQVFLNLISNARYALNKKYPHLDDDKLLRIEGQSIRKEDKSLVRITFEDHGIGIPPDLIHRVINPFFTTKPGEQGTGLGLSISYGILVTHGGCLTLESEHGAWTRVLVDLPTATKGNGS